MRVLHLINSLGLGGAQTIVKAVMESQKNNKNIFLFVLRHKKNEIRINHPNVFIYPTESVYSLKPLKELKNYIRENSIDILHCHLPRQQLFGYWIKKDFPNIKLIFHEHGNVFDSDYFVPLLLKIIQGRADRFIAVSNAIKKGLIEKASVDPSKIVVLYNFVDHNMFSRNKIKLDVQKERRKLNIKKNDFVAGYAGRIVYRKGWREFIKSASEISRKNPNFKFLIAGDGDEKEKLLESIEKEGVKDNVIYLGRISDMVWFYSLIDCFVLPSYWEGLPMVQLEAMAMEVPMVSCNGPGMDEVAFDNVNSLLCSPKDSNALSEKIIKLSENSALRIRLIHNGITTAKKYSLENFNKELNSIYLDILQNDKKKISRT